MRSVHSVHSRTIAQQTFTAVPLPGTSRFGIRNFHARFAGWWIPVRGAMIGGIATHFLPHLRSASFPYTALIPLSSFVRYRSQRYIGVCFACLLTTQ